MYKPNEDKFVEKSLRMLQNEFSKQGIAVFKIEDFKDMAIKIGKLYHEYMKKEEL